MSIPSVALPAAQDPLPAIGALQVAHPHDDQPAAITFKMKEQVHALSLGWKQRLLKLNKDYQVTTISGPGDAQQHQIRLGDVEITATQGCFNRTNSVIANASAGTRRILDDLMAIGMLAYPPTRPRSTAKSVAAQ